jgi:hypothetical protein
LNDDIGLLVVVLCEDVCRTERVMGMFENAERAEESSSMLSGSFGKYFYVFYYCASRQPVLTVFASEKFVAESLSSVSSA